MKKYLLLSLLFLSQYIFASHISPRTLRNLVIESEFIVQAEVLKIQSFENKENEIERKAIIVSRNILKGELQNDTIEVFLPSLYTCDPKPRYIVGNSILVFLTKYKNGFITHALHFGLKNIDTSTYEIYRARITEMQNILSLTNVNERRGKTIDWLISCVNDSITRWDGLYDLKSIDDSSYWENKNTKSLFPLVLNDTHKIKLRQIFFSINHLSYNDFLLMDMVIKENDTEITNFLIQKLKEIDLNKIGYQQDLMKKIAEQTKRDDLSAIVEKMNLYVKKRDFRKLNRLRKDNFIDKKMERKLNKLGKEFVECL